MIMEDFKNEVSKDNDEQLKDLHLIAIEQTGLNGPYQKTLMILICIISFSCSMILTSFPTQKELPEYHCFNKIEFEDSEDYLTYKYDNKFKVINNDECIKKYCHNEINFESPILWTLIVDFKSIKNFVTTLDIMCELDNYSANFSRMIFIGRILATIIFSYMFDTYGRKKTFFTVSTLLVISNILFLLTSNKHLYLILGMLSNMCMYNYNAATIISVELMDNNLYAICNGLLGSMFAICGIFSIFIMIIFKNWYVLIFFHLIIDIIALYYLKDYLVETFNYSLSINDYKTLNESIVKISKINGTYDIVNPILERLKQFRRLPKSRKLSQASNDSRLSPSRRKLSNCSRESVKLSMHAIIHEMEQSSKLNSYSLISVLNIIFDPYIKLFKNEDEIIKLGLLVIPFVSMNFIYYGQLMFVERIPGSLKLNSMLIFLSEVFAPHLAGYLLQTNGRKILLGMTNIFSLIICIIFTQTTNPYFCSVLLFLNCFSCAITFVVTYVYSAEIFDDRIKGSANGFLMLVANFSLVISDFLMDLLPSPFYLFALLNILSIVSYINLKETLKVE